MPRGHSELCESDRIPNTAVLLSYLQYPKLCREEVSIHLIQSREHILNTVRSNNLTIVSYSDHFNSTLKPYLNMLK